MYTMLLQWLEKDFLCYLEASVSAQEGFTKAEKASMTLSKDTLEGLRLTGMILHCIYQVLYTCAMLLMCNHYYAPPHESRTSCTVQKKQMIPRYTNGITVYAKEICVILVFSGDGSAIKSRRLFEHPLRITKCYQKLICVREMQSHNVHSHLCKN